MGKVKKSTKRRYDSEPPRPNKRSKQKKFSYAFSDGTSELMTEEIDLRKKTEKLKEEKEKTLVKEYTSFIIRLKLHRKLE